MELGLRGKTAVVTGASQGIGQAIARALHAEGVAVVMVSQTAETLRTSAASVASIAGVTGGPKPAQPAEVHTVVADLSLWAEVERVAQESISLLGHVDILVNNASRTRTGNFFEARDAEIEEMLQLKALGYVRMVRALAPHMMERREGSIVNIIGSAARTPTTDFIAGSMANAALVNFTRGISRELARSNVRINSISPGWTLTERQSRSFQLQAQARQMSADDLMRQAARAIPLSRLVTTDEIATLTLLLASDVFPSMTGEDIVIDGGATPSI